MYVIYYTAVNTYLLRNATMIISLLQETKREPQKHEIEGTIKHSLYTTHKMMKPNLHTIIIKDFTSVKSRIRTIYIQK